MSVPDTLPNTIGTLRRLVGFDTVSSNSNVELIDWVANRLDDLGVTALVQHGAQRGKANLFATIGPQDVPGVMLSGHSDVVPVAGQDWSADPFRLTERDGRLYGRGSADMKGFIACCLEAVPRFAAARLRTPVHLALSYDEETDMGGMRQLAAHLAAAPVRPAACIIGEPTMMQVVVANKGAAIYRCRVRGHSVHSSLRDRGVSAVEVAAEIVAFLNRLQRSLNGAERHDGFEFPHTSVHAGMIHGGTAHNITARDCEIVFEVRALPGVAAADVVARVREHCERVLLPPMRTVSPDCDIAIEEILDAPGLDERGNVHLARAIMPLCDCVRPGRVSFGTEAGILQGAGVPTIVCGPGDIRVAHQPDEFVEAAQLGQCLGFLDRLAGRLERGDLPLG
jgi:acetylornithine deacetylase